MSHSCCGRGGRLGLTLLELVVVMGILAALSTIAIRSLEPIADQARYEQTQSAMNDLKAAVVGYEDHGLTRSAIISGYISDVGQLPLAQNSLLVRPGSLIDRSIQTFDSDRDSVQDVTLTSGWNGPYLHLTAGLQDIADGWGRALNLSTNSGSLTILSQGADGDSALPEDGYQKDLAVSITPREYLCAITFRVFAIDSLNGSRINPDPSAYGAPGLTKLAVLFYGVNANGGTTGAVEEQSLIISNFGSFEYRRDDTIASTVAARAILWEDLNGNDRLDAIETVFLRSFVHYPMVQPGVDIRVEMELR